MTQPLADHVAAEIRAEMGRQHRSQRWLAEVLGLSQAQISDRYRGEVEFRISELEMAAVALGVPVAQFVPTPARAS